MVPSVAVVRALSHWPNVELEINNLCVCLAVYYVLSGVTNPSMLLTVHGLMPLRCQRQKHCALPPTLVLLMLTQKRLGQDHVVGLLVAQGTKGSLCDWSRGNDGGRVAAGVSFSTHWRLAMVEIGSFLTKSEDCSRSTARLVPHNLVANKLLVSMGIINFGS